MKFRALLNPAQVDALKVLATRRGTTTTVVMTQAICRNVTTALLRYQKLVPVHLEDNAVSKCFSLAPHVYETLFLFAESQGETLETCARWLLQEEISKFLFKTQTASAVEHDRFDNPVA